MTLFSLINPYPISQLRLPRIGQEDLEHRLELTSRRPSTRAQTKTEASDAKIDRQASHGFAA